MESGHINHYVLTECLLLPIKDGATFIKVCIAAAFSTFIESV